MTTDSARQTIQDEILLAALPNIIFDGWTLDVMNKAALDAGHESSMAVRAFPSGVDDFISHFADYVNRQMLLKIEEADFDKMGVGPRIEAAFRIRFDIEAPYKEAVRKAMSFYALPQNIPLATQMVWKAVDDIWWGCGDASVDFNYYTKRASLAAVYSATMLYWVNDDSENDAETMLFLRRRLIDIVNAVKTRKEITGKIKGLFCKLTGHRPNTGLLKR